jgi:secreted PhoX family phosphatase
MKKDKTVLIALIAAVISISGFSVHTFANTGKLIRIATVPAGSEVAGLAVNNVGELFFNSQHPDGKVEVVDDGHVALI